LEVYYYVVNTSGSVLDLAMYLMVFSYLLWGTGNWVRQLRAASVHRERRQIAYVLSATAGLGFLVILLDVLHGYEAIHFYASRVLFLLIGLSFAYVILGNRLLVLRRLGKEGLAYSLVTGLVFAFYLVVIRNIAAVLAKQLSVSSLVVESFMILTLAFVFRPLVVRIQSAVDNLFRQSAFRRRREFIAFSREALHLMDFAGLARRVIAFTQESLSSSGARLLVTQGAGLQDPLAPEQIIAPDDSLSGLLQSSPNPREVAELLEQNDSWPDNLLGAYNGGYVIPLAAAKGPVGLLLVGPKTNGRYTGDEQEFFAVFGNEVGMAIERIMLAEGLRREAQRAAQSEKLAALGRLTAGIAHEFRNPLNIIATSAQTILRNPDDISLHRETGEYILEETVRLNRTVEDFLQFARPHTPVWQETNLEELLDRVIVALQKASGAGAIHLTREVPEALPTVTTSPQHLERALRNLGMNAIEAMQGKGHLVFSVHCQAGDVAIDVRDDGPGISPQHQARLFDPFFTTKPAGTGLGLPIVHMMIEVIQGRISFVPTTRGTTFLVELPIRPTIP
jgi:signal transduction histidine kinase